MTDETREIVERWGRAKDYYRDTGDYTSLTLHGDAMAREIERLRAEVERLRDEPVGYVVVCRNRLGEVHHIASAPRHMHPWTLEYAQAEARRIHHNDDWLTCTVHPVGAAASDGRGSAGCPSNAGSPSRR